MVGEAEVVEWIYPTSTAIAMVIGALLVYRANQRSNRTAERAVAQDEYEAAMHWKQEQLDELRDELRRQDQKCQDDLARIREAHAVGMSAMQEQLHQVQAVAAMDLGAQIAGPLLEMLSERAPIFAARIAEAMKTSADRARSVPVTPPRGMPALPTDITD